MKIFNIIHQQIAQLKWHIIACFGLVMVLPLEQAIVNYNDGDGFYPDNSMLVPAMLISVLLAGLIGCSNVQADFKERRYAFWRSKPINAKLFIVLKYFTGLIVAFLIMLSPVIFYYLSLAVSGSDPSQPLEKIFVIIVTVIALLAYSFCFACNILVRKTARSWLIGLTLTCLVFLMPLILPFNYRLADDGHGGFFFKVLTLIMAGGSVGAFVFAILAADRNWHLKTNLKGLLWVGAALLFSLMLLFSTQIANIRVLDEKEVQYAGQDSLATLDGRIMLNYYGYVDVAGDRISLEKFNEQDYNDRQSPSENKDFKEYMQAVDNKEFHSDSAFRRVFYMLDGDLYRLNMTAFYKFDKTDDGEDGNTRNYKKLFLIRRKLTAGDLAGLVFLDLSDSLLFDGKTKPGRLSWMAMRRCGDKLVIINNRNIVEVDLSALNQLAVVDEKTNAVKYRRSAYRVDDKEYKIQLLPVQGLSLEDSVRFSIDIHIGNIYGEPQRSFEFSCVDMKNDKTVFAFYDEDEGFIRCEVTRIEDETIYYKTTAVRESTILESTVGSHRFYYTFVADGRLYAHNDHELFVFDIRSGSRISKLGHFVRYQTTIRDVEALDDGNILMAMEGPKRINKKGDTRNKSMLTLLKRP